MNLILPVYDTCRKIEIHYWYLICYAQKPSTVSENYLPVAQNHRLKMMTQPSKNADFLHFRWLRSPFGKALSYRNLSFDFFEGKTK
jgi:hypothetical protein